MLVRFGTQAAMKMAKRISKRKAKAKATPKRKAKATPSKNLKPIKGTPKNIGAKSTLKKLQRKTKRG